MKIRIYINNDKNGIKIEENIENVDTENFKSFVEDLKYYLDERLSKINEYIYV